MTRSMVTVGAAAAAVVVVAATVALMITGRGGADPAAGADRTAGSATSISTSTSSPGPAMPEPAPQQCVGHDLSAAAAPLPTGADVATMTLCAEGSTNLAGSGIWSSWETRDVPVDRLAELVAALSVPSATPAPDRVCDLVYIPTPIVVATFSDGGSSLVRVPDDGCHPRERVRDLVSEITATVTPTVEPIALQTPERNLITGCLGAKALTPTSSYQPAVVVPDGALSACVYVTGTGGDTTLTAAGPVAPDQVRRLLDTLTKAPPADCASLTPDEQVGSFVVVTQTPAAVPPGVLPTFPAVNVDVISVQTDGCHIVTDNGWTILGWADPTLVAELVAGTT